MESGLTRLKWQVLSQGAEGKVRSWARNEPSTESFIHFDFGLGHLVHFGILQYGLAQS